MQRLITRREIDDGEPRLHQRDVARNMTAAAIGAAMRQCAFERIQRCRFDRHTRP